MRVTPRASVGLTAALLLAVALAHAATTDWPLDDPTAYEFDPSDVELASGAATLLPALGGTGADGDLTVTTTTFNLSSDTTASRAVADGVAWSVTDVLSAGATTLTLQAFAGGLAASDELLLMAVQGTPGAAGAAGTWELVGVSAVEVGGLVTVAPLANDYDGVGYAVVAQRVPHYADVTLTDATVTADGWDGVTGGVVAFRAAGTLTADAPSVITATGLGFRGGAVDYGFYPRRL